MIGGGVDFNSDAVVATFQPNQQSTTVRIPIVCDTEVEGNERFNLTLTTNPPVMLGARNTAIGVIQDSTGTLLFHYYYHYNIKMQQLLFPLEYQITAFLKVTDQG